MAKKEKVSVEVAMQAIEVASREQWLDLAYSFHNTLDEQVAWAAKLWCEKNLPGEHDKDFSGPLG